MRQHHLALVALFVALGGTGAWAAQEISSGDIDRNAIRSKHIKRGQVKGTDVREPSLGTVPNADRLDGVDSAGFLRSDARASDSELLDGIDSAEFLRITGKAADAESIDGLDSSALQIRWARVTSGGTVESQSGGISASQTATGFYQVDFGSSIANKGLIATLSTFQFGDRMISVDNCNQAGLICGTTPEEPPNEEVALVKIDLNTGVDANSAFYIALLP